VHTGNKKSLKQFNESFLAEYQHMNPWSKTAGHTTGPSTKFHWLLLGRNFSKKVL
jgi:hypothetical protein